MVSALGILPFSQGLEATPLFLMVPVLLLSSISLFPRPKERAISSSASHPSGHTTHPPPRKVAYGNKAWVPTGGLSLSTQAPPMIPELGWLPPSLPFTQPVLIEGLRVPARWSRLRGHKNEKTWLSLRSSEPKCGNKSGIGETSVGLEPLLVPTSPPALRN